MTISSSIITDAKGIIATRLNGTVLLVLHIASSLKCTRARFLPDIYSNPMQYATFDQI